jgi:AcrR family transcriptional regulator
MEKIFNAALDLIKEKGYEKTTLIDICQAAGIANGTFYHYFKSKQDILLCYVKQESEDINNFYNKLKKDSYSNVLLEVMEYQTNYFIKKGSEFVSNFYSITLLSKNNYFDYSEFSINKVIIDCFRKGQENKEFTKNYSPEYMYDLAAGLLYKTTTMWCISKESFDLKNEIHNQFRNLIQLLGNSQG